MLGDEKMLSTDKQMAQVKKLEALLSEFNVADVDTGMIQMSSFFDGVFCNYFSIGFDAAVAFLFHKECEQHPERFKSPLMNKVVYMQKSPVALSSPLLHDKVVVMVRNTSNNEIEELQVPGDSRAVVLLNIKSYAGGNKLTRVGETDDGLLEVVFVSKLPRTVMANSIMPFLLFRVAAQTNMVCIRTKCALHCQIDGEPWLQSEAVFQITHYCRNALLKKSKPPSPWNCASQNPNM